MGSDNLEGLHKWKNSDLILSKYPIYVYPRPGYVQDENLANVEIVEAPLMEISSTFIRSAIKEDKNIKPMLPHLVYEHLDKIGLYK